MGRSGYVEDWDCDSNYYFLIPSILKRAATGRRGREFLQAVAAGMDAMPEKILIDGELIDETGACCTMGVVCKARGLDVSSLDYDDAEAVGKALNISPTLAREIAFQNDDDFGDMARGETPAERWVRMRKWVAEQLEAAASV